MSRQTGLAFQWLAATGKFTLLVQPLLAEPLQVFKIKKVLLLINSLVPNFRPISSAEIVLSLQQQIEV